MFPELPVDPPEPNWVERMVCDMSDAEIREWFLERDIECPENRDEAEEHLISLIYRDNELEVGREW